MKFIISRTETFLDVYDVLMPDHLARMLETVSKIFTLLCLDGFSYHP